MVSVTPALRYHPPYQRRFSMYIHGMFPRNFAELVEAVSFDLNGVSLVGDRMLAGSLPGVTCRFPVVCHGKITTSVPR